MSELIDRRVSPRIFCDFSVDYEARGARAELGRISNIGTGGMLLTMQGGGPSSRGRSAPPLPPPPQQSSDQGCEQSEVGDPRDRRGGVRRPEPSCTRRDVAVLREGVGTAAGG